MDTQSELTSSKQIIAYLSNQFPNCFTIEGEAKPLKIGIFQDIIERLADNEHFSKTKLRLALRLYTASWRYLHSIKDGANRVDLDGQSCDVITGEQAAHAQAQLKESKEKVKAKKIAENKDKVPRTPRSAKFKSKPNTSKTTNPTQQRAHKNIQHKVNIEQLQVDGAVKVLLGSKPVPATILGIEKENIKVKVSSGMELTVTIEHISL